MGCSESKSECKSTSGAYQTTDVDNTKRKPIEKLAKPLDVTREKGNYPIVPVLDNAIDVVGTDFIPPVGGREGRASLKVDKLPDNANSPIIVEIDVRLPSGVIYKGQHINNRKHGKGFLKFPDGSTYEGQFEDDVAQGIGEWRGKDGSIYSGEWKNDKINGHGKFVHPDGSTYIGQWMDDMKHGKGKELWADGTVYEGTFIHGEKNEGHLKFPDGSTYDGQMKGDAFSGEGTYNWSTGRRYVGQWENGLMNGTGVYEWPSGQFLKYEGCYKDGVKCGNGKLYYADGRIYSGTFMNNTMHGTGIEIWPRGEIRKGEWANGKLIEWVTLDDKGVLEYEEKKLNMKYEIVPFSNPEEYHKLLKGKEKGNVILKKGICCSESTAYENIKTIKE